MPHKNSLAAPSPASHSISRRRRSADHRYDLSASAPATPTPKRCQSPGSSPYRPTSPSSDDDSEEDTRPVRRVPKKTSAQSNTLPPQLSSAKVPRSRQPKTPANVRTAPIRDVATDPGSFGTARRSGFGDDPIIYQRRRSLIDLTRESDDDGKDIKDNHNHAKVNPMGQKTSIETSAQRVHVELIGNALKSLTDGEREGYVYILRVPKNKGLLKLGCTVNPRTRDKQHEKCGLEIERIHTSDPVKHMKRAERLAHIDLKHMSRPWKCSHCDQEHQEWFKVDEEKAEAVVTSWVRWINEQRPYDHNGRIKPVWGYLLSHGRRPRTKIDHHGHTARWAHWAWVLSAPSDEDFELLAKYNDNDKTDKESTQIALQRSGDRVETALTYRQRTPTQYTAPTGMPIVTDVMKAVEAVVSKQITIHRTKGNIIINIGCNITGDASASRSSQG